MEPVEINAGRCYLRAFRADDRLDDRPALVEAFADQAMRTFVRHFEIDTLEQAGEYLDARNREWETQERVSWAIAEPTTGALIGEVGIKHVSPESESNPEIAIWVHHAARRRGIAESALSAVVRFGWGALDLEHIDYVCDEDNAASAALAARCGFTYAGPTTSVDGLPAQLWTLKNA